MVRAETLASLLTRQKYVSCVGAWVSRRHPPRGRTGRRLAGRPARRRRVQWAQVDVVPVLETFQIGHNVGNALSIQSQDTRFKHKGFFHASNRNDLFLGHGLHDSTHTFDHEWITR